MIIYEFNDGILTVKTFSDIDNYKIKQYYIDAPNRQEAIKKFKERKNG